MIYKDPAVRPESRFRPQDDKRAIAQAPPGMASRKAWVCWNWEFKESKAKDGTGRWAKQPISPKTLGNASSTNPATWASLDDAITSAVKNNYSGVGFVFSDDDPFVVIDIDGGIVDDGVTTCEESEFSQEIRRNLPETWTERSQSGLGLHLVFELEEGAHWGAGRNNQKIGLEVYQTARYIATTFVIWGDQYSTPSPIAPISQERLEYLKEFFDAPGMMVPPANAPGRSRKKTVNAVELDTVLASQTIQPPALPTFLRTPSASVESVIFKPVAEALPSPPDPAPLAPVPDLPVAEDLPPAIPLIVATCPHCESIQNISEIPVGSAFQCVQCGLILKREFGDEKPSAWGQCPECQTLNAYSSIQPMSAACACNGRFYGWPIIKGEKMKRGRPKGKPSPAAAVVAQLAAQPGDDYADALPASLPIQSSPVVAVEPVAPLPAQRIAENEEIEPVVVGAVLTRAAFSETGDLAIDLRLHCAALAPNSELIFTYWNGRGAQNKDGMLDMSEVVWNLAKLLAFYFPDDAEGFDRAMRYSPAVSGTHWREKWDSNRGGGVSHGAHIVNNAWATCNNFIDAAYLGHLEAKLYAGLAAQKATPPPVHDPSSHALPVSLRNGSGNSNGNSNGNGNGHHHAPDPAMLAAVPIIGAGFILPTPNPNAEVLSMESPTALAAKAVKKEMALLNRRAVDEAEAAEKIAEDWEELLPLPVYTIAPFPVEVLPRGFREFCEETAHAMQSPVEVIAMLGITAFATILSESSFVRLTDEWKEPTNLYTLQIQDSGARKSGVHSAAYDPVHAIEDFAREQDRVRVSQLLKDRRNGQKKLKDEKKSLDISEQFLSNLSTRFNQVGEGSAEEKDALYHELMQAQGAYQVKVQAYAQLETEVENMEKPAMIKFLVDDITPEAACKMLGRQNERLTIASAESQVFMHITGLYSKGTNLNVWLKGHAGDSLDVARVSTDADVEVYDSRDRITCPRITMAIAVQPDVLSKAVGNDGKLTASGLMGRFVYVYPHSNIGDRAIIRSKVSSYLKDGYQVALTRLFKNRADQKAVPPIFYFSPEAEEPFDTWRMEQERRQAQGGLFEDMQSWGSKFPGLVGRLAALLHAIKYSFDLESLSPNTSLPLNIPERIPVSTVQDAIKLGNCLATHARRAFGKLIDADGSRAKAGYLVERFQCLQSKGKLEIYDSKRGDYCLSKRELFSTAWRKFSSLAELDKALVVLEERGYVKVLKVGPASKHKILIAANVMEWKVDG